LLGTSYFAGALAGSSVVLLDAPAEPEPEDGSAFCSLLGAAELELEELLGAALEPPEAAPDFVESADEELGGVTPMDVLDEEEPGVAGVDEAPALDEAPGAVDGDDGVALSLRAVLLELGEPGAFEVRLVSSRLHAARPKASATASARVVSFMCPPWLGYRKKAARGAPGLTP
jgi:hypothetical protein